MCQSSRPESAERGEDEEVMPMGTSPLQKPLVWNDCMTGCDVCGSSGALRDGSMGEK